MVMLVAETPSLEPRATTLPSRARDISLVACACLFAFALSWPHLVEVWRTGTFFDTDDAMRMVEVRAWLAGQGWYDLTAHRLVPPAGLPMHWSRVVDVPVGALVLLFERFVQPVAAERLARIVFPLCCQGALIVVFLQSANVLCGPAALVPALLLVVFSGFEYGQFVAGRIDHHAPQIVLLVAMVGSAAAMLRSGDARPAWSCAACIAVSLGISLENLPFIATTIAVLVLTWLRHGERAGLPLTAFGVGLATLVPAVFVATVPPSRYGLVANDALSAPHVLLAVLGGTVLAALTRSRVAAATLRRRSAALATGAGLAAAAVLIMCPGFPADPYGGIDPVVRSIWLAQVTEAMPLRNTIDLHPAAATLVLAPILAGLASAAWAGVAAPSGARSAWRLVAAVTATGLAGALWQVRVASSAMPLAALGGVWAVSSAAKVRTALPLWRLDAVRVIIALLPFTPFAWVLVPVPDDAQAVTEARVAAEECREADALAPLVGLPPGLAFAPIDVGSHLLAHTDLAVLGAPYHRNNSGNRAVIEGFLAPAAVAEARIRAAAARYVVICPGSVQITALTQAAPDGLAAALLRGDVPPWLAPVALGTTPYRVYELRQP